MWSSPSPKCYAWDSDDNSSDASKRSHLNVEDDYSFTSLDNVGLTHHNAHDRARAQHKGKRPTTSSIESPATQKRMVNKLYKTNEKISQSKLYEHFTADMNDDVKGPQISCKKWASNIKTRWGTKCIRNGQWWAFYRLFMNYVIFCIFLLCFSYVFFVLMIVFKWNIMIYFK